MPNLVAYLALIGWVPAALLFFRTLRPVTAATITILGASVLLPANFSIDFPGLPPVDRHVVGALACLIGYYLFVPPSLRNARRARWPAILIGTQVLCAFISVSTNSDPLHYGGIKLPGLSEYDALGVAFHRLVTIGVPFFLGSRLIRSHQDVQSVLRVIVFFGLVNVPLILWEVRMSPQLHATLYGYFPHVFSQHIRSGGFRPVVFTSHSLELALFMATAVIASLGLLQAGVKILGTRAILSFVILLVGLAFCKSLGPLLFGLLVPALMITTKVNVQAKAAMLMSFVVLLYPLLRSQELFPTGVFVEAAETVSHDRAYSLEFRFKNEDLLLQKARERPLFGWGTWGRNLHYDALTGTDMSVTDGYWILEMGMFGLTGFLSFFSLLLTPVILSARRLRFVPPGRQRALIVALILLVLVRAVDLLPNAFFAPFTLFLAGALMQFATETPSVPALPEVKPEPDGLRQHGVVAPGRPASSTGGPRRRMPCLARPL
jgi:hypothetical protein